MKNRKLNQWLWKWHFLAGIISLPFVLVLSITGAVYLFNPEVEKEVKSKAQLVSKKQGKLISYQKQWQVAKKNMKKRPTAMIIPNEKGMGVEFVSGRFSHKSSLFVDPYTGNAMGSFSPKSTWMYTVRKLHGELLGGKVGTKIVELIACWMIVLIITGLYVWWPFKRGIQGVFTIRFKEGKRILFRDMHAVLGFWMSFLLLLTLAGGLPWTDVFGGNFKWVQKVTNTGYPKTWSGRGLKSEVGEKPLSLDDMFLIAKKQNLEGVISIGLPKSEASTFSVSNETYNLGARKMLHFDQYTGALIKSHVWSDVGVLMRARMWVMAFHQGQFGSWNWCLMFGIAIVLTIMSLAAIISYLYRKPKDGFGVPKVSKGFKLSTAFVVLIGLVAIVLPLFGVSLVLLIIYEYLKKKRAVVTN
ncbi:Uncharacterized iron-regulated membrane protein [Tenacibaculum sp. 190524A02b]|uniref:Uncharacterized iron-regulated membrane protein n=1 Tax=Tenacibaculum vairaonense TaxID=3137860 RepID=A0ABP1F9E6_9FLAO